MREIKSSRTSPSFPSLQNKLGLNICENIESGDKVSEKNLAISSDPKNNHHILPEKSDTQFDRDPLATPRPALRG